jgi:YesN/AraC family two-component response regulator
LWGAGTRLEGTGRRSADDLRTILVVDDEPGALRLIGLILKGRYALRTARSAAEARKILEEARPDLMILDVRLAGEDGLDILAEFRRGSSAPVLVVTGFGSEEVAARAIELNANGYLRKPFTPEQLRSRVANLLAEGPRIAHVAERARDVIDGLAGQSVSAGEIAERLGISPRHLGAAFLERFGCTPLQYLRGVRMRLGRQLLVTTKLPIAEIAIRSGFRDVSYFGRFFRREHGMTPAEFRRTHVPESAPASAEDDPILPI